MTVFLLCPFSHGHKPSILTFVETRSAFAGSTG